MKTNVASSVLAFAVNGVRIRVISASTNPTCDCQPFPPERTSFTVSRLYNIVDPSWTAQDVMNQSNIEFASVVTHMDGFQRYMASSTGNSSTVFYMNQFDTKEQAHAALEASQKSLAGGKLDGVLERNIFIEAEGFAAFPTDSCITESSKGHHLAVRFYHYLDPASINSTILLPFVEGFFTSVLKDDEGLVTYYSAANVPEGNEAVVWDIFETEEQVIATNEKAANYTNPDWPAYELITRIEGEISFDYTCAAGNLPDKPAGPTPATAPSAAFSASVSGTVVAAIFMVFWKVL